MVYYLIDLGHTIRIGRDSVRYIGPFYTQSEAHERLKALREQHSSITLTEPNISLVYPPH